MTREPVNATPRKTMTPARRKRVLEANGSVCGHEGCEITARLEIDHIIALELGGSEEDRNLVPLCYDHHKQKSRRDAWLIAKARRIRRREAEGPKPSFLRSRPFPKDLRKRMDGTVVRRPT